VKFTPEGGLITVSAERLRYAVQFTVADSGVGIGADEIEHVFDRFWQSRRARRGGAGLGLAITKGIVEAHDGTITVASVAGEGTTFTVVMPTAVTTSPN
jgi:signal transduction histidine kinase